MGNCLGPKCIPYTCMEALGELGSSYLSGDCPELLSIRGPIFGLLKNNAGPYINFPHFGNSILGLLPSRLPIGSGAILFGGRLWFVGQGLP